MILAEVFARVLEQDAETFTDESNPDTVFGWTSLRHVLLLVSVEGAYGVKFSNAELATLRSMGDVRAALARKGAQVS
jgi:acyl carrier protein